MPRKKVINNFFSSYKFLAILGFVVILGISYPLAKNISRQYKINSEIKNLRKEIAAMEQKKSNLSQLIEFFSSEQYVDQQARLNLNLKKAGEEVVVIKDKSSDLIVKEDNNSLLPENKNIAPDNKNLNPIRWYYYFFR